MFWFHFLEIKKNIDCIYNDATCSLPFINHYIHCKMAWHLFLKRNISHWNMLCSIFIANINHLLLLYRSFLLQLLKNKEKPIAEYYLYFYKYYLNDCGVSYQLKLLLSSKWTYKSFRTLSVLFLFLFDRISYSVVSLLCK